GQCLQDIPGTRERRRQDRRKGRRQAGNPVRRGQEEGACADEQCGPGMGQGTGWPRQGWYGGSQGFSGGIEMKIRTLMAVALAAGLAHAGQAAADVTLRVADSLPVGHFFSNYATKYWMEEITKRTKGEVKFQYYPAEQLGKAKDLLALTQSGVADVGYVVPSYASDKMPLTAVAELPGSFSDSCSATLAYEKLARDDGILAQKEFKPNGVRLMFTLVLPPYQVFSGKKPIENIKSL